MKVLVGSTNPVKIQSTKEAFEKYFDNVEVIGVKVASGVSDQPINDDTFLGAKNRAQALIEKNTKEQLNADFFVGIEGGLTEIYSIWFVNGVMCIIDKNGRMGFGTTAHFEIPKHITSQLLNGKELGLIIDELSGKSNTKHEGGASGFFTNGVIKRKEYYIPGIIHALIPFVKKDIFTRAGQNP